MVIMEHVAIFPKAIMRLNFYQKFLHLITDPKKSFRNPNIIN